jgi:hypothetical protein
MHPIANSEGWVAGMYSTHWRHSIPMDASSTSNGLYLDCDWRTRCRCHGTASIHLTDGFTRARFRSLGYSTFGKWRLAGRVWGYPCRCVVTVPSCFWSVFSRGTIESTITCASGKARNVEIKRAGGGLGAYRIDKTGGWKNYLLAHRGSREVARMLLPDAASPPKKCVVCDWLFAGSLLSMCLFSETVGVVDMSFD